MTRSQIIIQAIEEILIPLAIETHGPESEQIRKKMPQTILNKSRLATQGYDKAGSTIKTRLTPDNAPKSVVIPAPVKSVRPPVVVKQKVSTPTTTQKPINNQQVKQKPVGSIG